MRPNNMRLNKSADRLALKLAPWSAGSGSGLDTYIITGLLLNHRYEDITQEVISAAIKDLHSNQDADASDLAEQLDRWYSRNLRKDARS